MRSSAWITELKRKLAACESDQVSLRSVDTSKIQIAKQ